MNFLKNCIFIFFFAVTAVFGQSDLLNRFRLAQTYEQSGEYEKALVIYQEVYNKQPDNYQFFDALNRAYIQVKNYSASISLLESRIAKYPYDISMKGLLGSTYYIMGKSDAAYEIWEKALTDQKASESSYRIMANYAIELRAYEKAIEFLQEGKKTASNPRFFSYDLGALYSIKMMYPEAAREYCELLRNSPDDLPMIQSNMGSFINKPQAFEPVVKVIKEYSEETEDVSYKYLLADLYMQSNRYDESYEIYKDIDINYTKNGSELFNFAERAFRKGYFEAASKAYNDILKSFSDSPFAPNAKIGYARTLEESLNAKYKQENTWKTFSNPKPLDNAGEYSKVIAAYDELVKNYPKTEIASEAYYRIGLVKLNRFNDYGEARKYFNLALNEQTITRFTSEIYNQIGRIEIINGRLDSSKAAYEQMDRFSRGDASNKNMSLYMRSKIEFWQGHFKEAASYLSGILKSLEDDIANDAIQLSMIMNISRGDSVNLLKFAQAEYSAERKQYGEAEEVYKALAENPRLLLIKDICQIRIAEMEIALDNYTQALEQLDKIAGQEGKNIYSDKALFLSGKIYQFGLADKAKAVEVYEKLLAKFPNSLYLDIARDYINSLNN
jgi:tetratricopeptide (TPR) repeat protein